LILQNCGKVRRGHFRLGPFCRAHQFVPGAKLCLGVLAAAKSFVLAWFIFMIPSRCLGIGSVGFRRNDLRLSFFKRVQAWGCLASVTSIMLFVGDGAKAAEPETLVGVDLAEVGQRAENAVSSGGQRVAVVSDLPLKGRRTQVSARGAALAPVVDVDGGRELAEVYRKGGGTMFSGGWLRPRSGSVGKRDGVPTEGGQSNKPGMVNEREVQEEGAGTLSQIIRGTGARLDGGWLEAAQEGLPQEGGRFRTPGSVEPVPAPQEDRGNVTVEKGEKRNAGIGGGGVSQGLGSAGKDEKARVGKAAKTEGIGVPPKGRLEGLRGVVVPSTANFAPLRVGGGNYQPGRESGPDVAVPVDREKTFVRIPEGGQDAMLSGGWLGAMASGLPPASGGNQAPRRESGGNFAPTKEAGLDTVVPDDEEGVAVRRSEGGEDIILPTREGGQGPGGVDASGDSNDPANQGPGAEPSLFPDTAYTPVNRVLDVFDTYDAGYQGDQLQAVATGSVGLPFITEAFDPDFADVKAGPVYLDFQYVGAGILYSSVNGDLVFPEGQEPGWLTMLELGMRGYVRLTDQFYLTLQTRLVYLPELNRFGFALGDESGLGMSFRLNYEFEWGTWDFLLYDQFTGYPPYSLLSSMGATAQQSAGRYTFGLTARDRRTNGFDELSEVYFVNTVGVEATTPFMWEDWRLWLGVDHSDYWRTFGLDYEGTRDHLGARLAYGGTEIPFAPYATYDVYSNDRMKSLYHTAYIGGGGRLTENVRFDGRVGQLWTTNRNPSRTSSLWELGLTHAISEDTWHSLWAGQTFEVDDFTNDTRLVEYIRYQINHVFSSRLDGYAFAQFSRDEDLAIEGLLTNRELYGAGLNYRMFDYSRISGLVYYEKESFDRDSAIEETRLIYRAEWEQRIGLRSTARFYYQFEKDEGRSNFDEHVLSLTVRRYF
jgi:hypothetical protein